MANPNQNPLPIRPQLPSLSTMPLEVLYHIMGHLSLSDIIRLSPLCQSLYLAAEPIIWRGVDLSASIPIPGSIPPAPKNDRDTVILKPSQLAHADLKRRIDNIIQSSNQRRLAAVRTLKISHRPGSLSGAVLLLDYVSANITSLVISVPDDYEPSDRSDHDSFDVRFLNHHLDALRCGAGLSFPNLTHITIGLHTITYVEFIPLLCRSTPKLLSLTVSVDYLRSDVRRSPSPNFPPLGDRYDEKELFNIPHLRIYYSDTVKLLVPRANPVFISQSQHSTKSILDFILRNSAAVEQLTIQLEGRVYTHGHSILDILHGVSERGRKLRDLNWRCGTVKGGILEMLSELQSLQRLVTDYKWAFLTLPPSHGLPTSPLLRSVHFDCTHHPRLSAEVQWSRNPLPLDLHLASWLRANPKLTLINFYTSDLQPTADVFPLIDQMERDGAITGTVHSITHAGSELLHVRLRVQAITVQGIWSDSARKCVMYTGRNRNYHSELSCGPEWLEYSDFEGRAVPREVLRRMKEKHGVEDWERRGVEVGAEAWKVITDWRRNVIA